MQRFTLVISLLAALLGDVATQKPCRTPEGQNGLCVPVNSCPPVAQLLHMDSSDPTVVQTLRKLRCTGNSFLLHVCCVEGNGGGGGRPTPTQPQVRPTPTQPTYVPTRPQVRPTPATGPDNGLGHRNLKLLPVNDCGVDSSNRIFYGNATELNEFPWMVMLRYRTPGVSTQDFRCGGTLISRRYVVTASHCINGRGLGNSKLTSVRLGDWDTRTNVDCVPTIDDKMWCNQPPTDLGVEEVITHPNYNPRSSNRYNDIALIRLSGLAPEKSNFIRPICLPIGNVANRVFTPGQKLFVSGWGMTENNAPSPLKLKAAVPVMERPKCQEAFKRWNLAISDTQLCAGGAADKADSCSGDSGGPLMVDEDEPPRTVLAGIVSFGPRDCGTVGSPGVYTRVSSYVPWILDNLRP